MRGVRAAWLLAIVGFGSVIALSDQPETRHLYAERISQTYNFGFGKGNISTPGNAAVEGGEFIQPGAFPKASYCAHCHEEAYRQWRQALHSNSFNERSNWLSEMPRAG